MRTVLVAATFVVVICVCIPCVSLSQISPEEILKLKKAGVSDDVIKALIEKGKTRSELLESPRAEEAYNYALQFKKDAKYDKAAIAFKNVVTEFPNTYSAPKALLRLSESLSELSKRIRREDLIDEWARASGLFSTNLVNYWTLEHVANYLESRDFSSIEEPLKEILSKYPQSGYGAEACLTLASLWLETDSGAHLVLTRRDVTASNPNRETFDKLVRRIDQEDLDDLGTDELNARIQRWENQMNAVDVAPSLFQGYEFATAKPASRSVVRDWRAGDLDSAETYFRKLLVNYSKSVLTIDATKGLERIGQLRELGYK